jgi:hypothetical protein
MGRGEDASASSIAAVNLADVPAAKARCAIFVQFSLYVWARKLGPVESAALKVGLRSGDLASCSEQN